MNYDIRKISDSFKEVHSRYYIDTNGTVYTSISENTNRLIIEGKRININGIRKELVLKCNTTNRQIISIENTKNKYFVMYDGTVLQRLSTLINEKKEVTVCLIRVFGGNDRGNRYTVHRLLAGVFIGDITNKEVHHKDCNRLNNNLENLQILSFEEHRGYQNFKINHTKFSND